MPQKGGRQKILVKRKTQKNCRTRKSTTPVPNRHTRTFMRDIHICSEDMSLANNLLRSGVRCTLLNILSHHQDRRKSHAINATKQFLSLLYQGIVYETKQLRQRLSYRKDIYPVHVAQQPPTMLSEGTSSYNMSTNVKIFLESQHPIHDFLNI